MQKKQGARLVIATLVAVLVAGTATWLFKHHSTTPPATRIPTAGQPTEGHANAPVSVVAFEYLKCQNCKNYSVGLFPTLQKKYIEPGKIRYTLIPLAFIPGSIPAANAALCLYDQKPAYFFQFVEYVYQNQPDESIDWATTPTLLHFAAEATPTANLKQLATCMIELRFASQLKANLALAGRIMKEGVMTPVVFVNGQQVHPLNQKTLMTAIENAQ